MKSRILSACALAACVSAAATVVAAAPIGARHFGQEAKQGAKQEGPSVSGDEMKAAEKINKAKTAEAKLQAAAEFLKKYPKSALRQRVAEAVAAIVLAEQDAQLQVSLAETYRVVFNQPGEADLVAGKLLVSYINAGRAEEAFAHGREWLAKNPEDVNILSGLTVLASNEANKNNGKFIAEGRRYGQQAVALIEADKRPASIEEGQWAGYKAQRLPAIYRELGVLAMRAGDEAAAKAAMEKAAELKSPDPAVYLVLNDFAGRDYERLSLEYRASEGAAREAALKRVEAHLDRMIELMARGVAAMDGKAQYQQALPQMRQDLEANYRYRHNNSDAGLQQLIDKYKQEFAAAPR
jgi:hypothetical protein